MKDISLMNSLQQVTSEENLISVHNSYDFSFNVEQTQGIFNLDNMAIAKYCRGRKCIVCISPRIKKLYFTEIQTYFSRHFPDASYQIEEIRTGEANKNLETVEKVCELSKAFSLDRRGLLIAIGGGILMDIVGFAASMYKRKIDYLRIPTTLLGQIDAGIGIKTGVNFKGSKNFIGSFYPPIGVINDIELLKSLDKTDILCGLSEIIKMAIIVDQSLFQKIEDHHRLLIDSNFQFDVLLGKEVNHLAILRMLEQLTTNFYEKDLERLVDFGHSFSPFIEQYSNFSIPHGIAVAMDMAISTEIAYLTGKIGESDRVRVYKLLLSIGLNIFDESTYHANLMWKSLNDIVLHRGGDLNLVIPFGIGQSGFIKKIEEINITILDRAINNLKSFQNELRSPE
jgi:3-dehydroquinate synthetase